MEEFERIKAYFSKLQFVEDTHTYNVGKDILPSVSSLIKKVTPPFDEDNISKGVAKRDDLTQEDVLLNWETIKNEACDRGTRVHDFAERYCFDRTLKPSCPQESAAKKFLDELPPFIVPALPELKMYHKEFGYAGTGDIPLLDKRDNSYIIGDYKTNKDLFKNFKGQKLLPPFSDMLNTPYSKYTIQLSYYQILLEQTGVRVSKRKLIWLRKDGEYDIFDLEDLTHKLKRQLKTAA